MKIACLSPGSNTFNTCICPGDMITLECSKNTSVIIVILDNIDKTCTCSYYSSFDFCGEFNSSQIEGENGMSICQLTAIVTEETHIKCIDGINNQTIGSQNIYFIGMLHIHIFSSPVILPGIYCIVCFLLGLRGSSTGSRAGCNLLSM